MTASIANHDAPLILLADDECLSRRILRFLLQKSSYQVVEATNGVECLEYFLIEKPDIVILDGRMPVMDGFTCCQKLRQMPEGGHIPILVLTGLEDEASIEQAFAVGATDYITKPINPIVFTHRLRQIYEASQAAKVIRESEEQHRSVLNSLKEVVFQTNLDGKLTFLNFAWADVTGFAVDESLDKRMIQFIHPDDQSRYLVQILKHTQRITHCCKYTVRFLHCDRGVSWVEVNSCPMFADNGTLIGFSGRLIDVTDRRKKEQYRLVSHTVTRLVAKLDDLKVAMQRWIQVICGNFNWDCGVLWQANSQQTELRNSAIWCRNTPELNQFTQLLKQHTIQFNTEIPEQVWLEQLNFSWEKVLSQLNSKDCQTEDFCLKSNFSLSIKTGGQILGIVIFFSEREQLIEPEFLSLMEALGSQLAQFMKRKQVEETLQRQHVLLQQELQRASQYVRSLLPAPLVGCVNIQSQFVPSMHLGGDAFDYYWLDQDHLIVYLLDVAGHGVKSALLSVSVMNILRSRSLANTDFCCPKSVLSSLNHFFPMSDTGDDYFTIWYGVYNRQSRQITYSSAGHPPALLMRADQDGTQIQELESDGIAIGLFPEYEFENLSCLIEPESSLFLFSDGAYEIQQPDGLLWGFQSFKELLQAYYHAQISGLEYVFRQVKLINLDQPLEDDFSLVEILL
jgi:phosphoserine phosphatase RsbU/P